MSIDLGSSRIGHGGPSRGLLRNPKQLGKMICETRKDLRTDDAPSHLFSKINDLTQNSRGTKH